ncbi:MAG: hypothetical protein RL154_1436, partial [Pseudomonadota bacterium]
MVNMTMTGTAFKAASITIKNRSRKELEQEEASDLTNNKNNPIQNTKTTNSNAKTK